MNVDPKEFRSENEVIFEIDPFSFQRNEIIFKDIQCINETKGLLFMKFPIKKIDNKVYCEVNNFTDSVTLYSQNLQTTLISTRK